MVLKEWKCIECGQIVIANENPTGNFPKWSDGHECMFKEEDSEK